MIKQKFTYLLIIISLPLLLTCQTTETKKDISSPAETRTYVQSKPGMPEFSVSYPDAWGERKPDFPGCVFRADRSWLWELPSVRVFIFLSGNLIKNSSRFYKQSLAQIGGKDIKMLYDREVKLNDGNTAQDVEFEWVHKSGNKINTYYRSVKKDNFWIVIVTDNSKGKTGKELKKIANSLKFRPDAFGTNSAPGLFVNKWPAFSVTYPKDWQKKTTDNMVVSLKAGTPDDSLLLHITIVPGINFSLKDCAKYFMFVMTQFNNAKNIKLISDKKTFLQDNTPAQEFELEWKDISGKQVNAFFINTKKDGTLITVSVTNNKGRVDDDLKKIAYSLKLLPEKQSEISYKYKIPEKLNDGWETAHIANFKINEQKLTGLVRKILNRTYLNIHSVLIVKNGKLVFEEYYPGFDMYKGYKKFTRNDLHGVMSVTKSFTSTLIGIAIDKGMIKGTDEKLLTFFPEYKKNLGSDNKGNIKLKDVLSMSAGLDWDEYTFSYFDQRNSNSKMWSSTDPLGYLLSRPVKSNPGSEFAYNSGLSMLLGIIVEKKTSMRFNEFAQKYLFEPLGITKFEWGYVDKNKKLPSTGGGLYLCPRDMAKLGQLFLNNGKWNNKQIISSEWIKTATKEHIKPPLLTGSSGYGYQWWLRKYNINNKIIEGYSANGWGGQFIHVFPGLNTIIVLTGGNYFYPQYLTPYTMMHYYILPAIVPSGP